jgi:general secretion pathway protein H
MTARRSGFTLLEMLVVIGILGLVAGVGYPAVTRAIDGQTFQTATKQIDLAVRRARSDAIRQQRTVFVPQFAGGRSDAAVSLTERALSPTVRIDQTDGLRFYRDGTANGGEVMLTSGNRIFRIVIDPQTGVVTSGLQ